MRSHSVRSHSVILSSGLRHNRSSMRQSRRPEPEMMPELELEARPALDHPIRVSPRTIDRACDLLDAPVADRYRVVLIMLIGGLVLKPLCHTDGEVS